MTTKSTEESTPTLIADTLLLILLKQQIAAWHISDKQGPRRLPIEGQQKINTKSAQDLCTALNDIKDRLQGDGLIQWSLQIIVDADSQNLIIECISDQESLFRPIWQILAWEWLQKHLDLPFSHTLWTEESAILPRVLSWISAESDQNLRKASIKEHEEREKKIIEQHQQEIINYENTIKELSCNTEKMHEELSQYCLALRKKEQEIDELKEENTKIRAKAAGLNRIVMKRSATPTDDASADA